MRLIIALCLAFATTARADTPVTTHTLSNGLDIVVIEDHRAPVVVQMVWYRAGAADEPPGLSGVAHYLEHLMFKATETRPAGALSDIVAANGGSDNAFTSWDYTAYFQRVAADRLPLMMELEADRMKNLRLTPDDIRTERDVILEERSQRTDSDPNALAREQARAAMFQNHPYGVPVIGWRHEMEALDRDAALDWYDTYYSPNNAILIVAGDVDPDEVIALAQQHYGPIPPAADLPPRIRAQEPPHLAERRLHFSDPRVSQPYLARSYLAPERDPGAQKQAAALVYLAELLGGSPFTSVLGRALQFDAQVAVFSGAYYGGAALDDTTFGLTVAPLPGVSLTDAEAALDAALDQFLIDGPDPDRMAALRTQIRAENIYARDNVQDLADRYGRALTQGLTVADVQAWPDVLQSVTAQDVLAVATQVLDRRASVTLYVTPKDAK